MSLKCCKNRLWCGIESYQFKEKFVVWNLNFYDEGSFLGANYNYIFYIFASYLNLTIWD